MWSESAKEKQLANLREIRGQIEEQGVEWLEKWNAAHVEKPKPELPVIVTGSYRSP